MWRQTVSVRVQSRKRYRYRMRRDIPTVLAIITGPEPVSDHVIKSLHVKKVALQSVVQQPAAAAVLTVSLSVFVSRALVAARAARDSAISKRVAIELRFSWRPTTPTHAAASSHYCLCNNVTQGHQFGQGRSRLTQLTSRDSHVKLRCLSGNNEFNATTHE